MNPRFYQRLDERIDAVNSHGLLAAIVLTWGLRPVDSGNSLPEAQVDLKRWNFSVVPADEFREAFLDAWRLERDYRKL